MTALTPQEAARMARGVYLLREQTVSAVQSSNAELGCEGLFKVDDSSRFVGASGGLFSKPLSGFGYIAEGDGKREGEIVVVTRGTNMGADWASNLNVSVEFGSTGMTVHAGFNEIWKSFASEIRSFMQGRNPSAIHCVGHSLGGALANLNADYFSGAEMGRVYLYTFGAPRVGLEPFSHVLTDRLGADSIFRVSHQADPVPMVPVFPFRHLPFAHPGYLVTNGGGLIRVGAHDMLGSYIPGVGDNGWSGLQTETPRTDWGERVKAWLESDAGHCGPAIFSATLLEMITRALQWVLKRAKAVLFAVPGAVVSGMTLLDQLAWLLSNGAKVSVEVAGYVKTLIGAIFRFLGRTANKVEDLTVAFLRWVLDLLFGALATAAVVASQRVGRSVLV
jgi:triacylglycerol lipase